MTVELSLKQRIERYIKMKNRPVSGGEIERIVAESTNYKPSNASRRCRELVNEGILKAEHRDGTVFYIWLGSRVDMAREIELFNAL